MLVGFADVCRHLAAGVVEAPRTDAAVVELRHQAVARDELQQDVLAEELQGWGSKVKQSDARGQEVPTLKMSFLIQGLCDRKSSTEKPGLARTAAMLTQ